MSEITEVIVPVLEVRQPIGDFYVGVMSARDLLAITYADIRTMENDVDRYVGIQRIVNKNRVKEIANFTTSVDATFPTGVVLAIKGECAEKIDNDTKLKIYEGINPETSAKYNLNEVASILDGQHRVEGLRLAGKLDFNVPVSIFVDADIADQAYIFATVNLAQTKVNKSLVYDLLDYAKARSPQKTAHDITVVLDKFRDSPFLHLIKRLGARTPGRDGETLAQATIVNRIIPLLSADPEQDRYDLARDKKVLSDSSSYAETPLRDLWVNNKDDQIARILLEYFTAVKETWPNAWNSRENGQILTRTNGFRAFMRLFKNIYLKEKPILDTETPVIPRDVYKRYFSKTTLSDADFTSTTFLPGTSGETALYKRLREDLGL